MITALHLTPSYVFVHALGVEALPAGALSAFRHFQLLPPRPTAGYTRGTLHLERVRKWYGLYVTGYVVMPEHVHLLISEPERASLAVAIQMLKQIVSYQLHKLAAGGPFWQARYYDFKRYIHRNPVKRGLVESPEQLAWSSFRHYISGVEGMVEIESQWTARKRERLGLALQIIRWDELPRPVSPKPGETRAGHPLK